MTPEIAFVLLNMKYAFTENHLAYAKRCAQDVLNRSHASRPQLVRHGLPSTEGCDASILIVCMSKVPSLVECEDDSSCIYATKAYKVRLPRLVRRHCC